MNTKKFICKRIIAHTAILSLPLSLLQSCNSAVENLSNQEETRDYSCSTPVARYDFSESSGNTIHDSSGLQPSVDLNIEDLNAVNFTASGLDITNQTKLISNRNQGTADRVITALRSNNSLTAEMWITPDNTTQDGPARIVSISIDYQNRNLTVGQIANQYALRLRTSTTTENGRIFNGTAEIDPLTTPAGSVTTELTHLVLTWDSQSAIAAYFINGELSASTDLNGDLSTWVDGYPLLLANELLYGRKWLGKYNYVAIYDCAMEQTQIKQRFSNGIPGAN